MPVFHRQHIPASRVGTYPLLALSEQIGSGSTAGKAVGASATTYFVIATPPRRSILMPLGLGYLASLVGTIVAAGGAAITVDVVKYDVSAAGYVALTTAVSLTNSFLTATNRSFGLTAIAGLTEDQLTVAAADGDQLFARVIAAGTVTTQPAAFVQVELMAKD